MNTIAIIPARGGSKRIPCKNIRNFLGVPIIARTVFLAKESGLFNRIVVSTEDLEIARIAKDSGAEIHYRKSSLADDYTTTVEVISNAVLELNLESSKKDLICCIYPVNPSLSKKRLQQGIEIFNFEELDYVFTAKKFESSPARSFRIGSDGFSEMYFPEFLQTRSQDLPTFFMDAAMFYFGTSEAWREKRPILNGKSKFILLDKYETLDIDEEEDWILMERLKRIEM